MPGARALWRPRPPRARRAQDRRRSARRADGAAARPRPARPWQRPLRRSGARQIVEHTIVSLHWPKHKGPAAALRRRRPSPVRRLGLGGRACPSSSERADAEGPSHAGPRNSFSQYRPGAGPYRAASPSAGMPWPTSPASSSAGSILRYSRLEARSCGGRRRTGPRIANAPSKVDDILTWTISAC